MHLMQRSSHVHKLTQKTAKSWVVMHLMQRFSHVHKLTQKTAAVDQTSSVEEERTM